MLSRGQFDKEFRRLRAGSEVGHHNPQVRRGEELAAGVATGSLITIAYARVRDWGVILPAAYLGAGIATALVIGALAGLYPALGAGRMAATEALRTV